jgi:hypothetical protein
MLLSVDEDGAVDQRRFPDSHQKYAYSIDGDGAGSERNPKLGLKLLTGGAGRSIDAEFNWRFPKPGTWAADKRAVQRHGVDLLTISLPSG